VGAGIPKGWGVSVSCAPSIPSADSKETERVNRKEKLKVALKILRKHGHEGTSVTQKFKSEYPFLNDILKEMLIEAQVFLEMSEDEFERKILRSMSYDSFKVLIFYYAEAQLKNGNLTKPVHAISGDHPLTFQSATPH
jgi:hypothetical protein